METIRLNLGSGSDMREGYINIDLYDDRADLKLDITKLPYKDNSVDEIISSHVIEHIAFKEAWDAMADWYKMLKPGGILKIETPDLLNLCKAFIAASEEERNYLYPHMFALADGGPGEIHRFLFTEFQLRFQLDNVGFVNIIRVEPDSTYYKQRNRANPEYYLNLHAYKKG